MGASDTRHHDWKLSGVVIDSSGAAVANTKIVLRKASSQKKSQADLAQGTTNQDGKFTFQLPPGFYDVEASKLKFKVARVSSVEVVASKVSKMKIGIIAAKGETQIVETCDRAASIDVTSSEVNQNFGGDCTGSIMQGAPEPRDLADLLRR